MFIEHYNSQLNRVIQSTNYQFSTMKYILILYSNITKQEKWNLTWQKMNVGNWDKYKQETFPILFLLFKKENLNRTHTVSRVVWKQGTLRWFIVNHCHDRRLSSDRFVDNTTGGFVSLPPIHKSSDCLGTVRLCPWTSDLLMYNQSSKTLIGVELYRSEPLGKSI